MNKIVKFIKKLSFLFTIVIFVLLSSCNSKKAKSKLDDIYIISTNDIHCAYEHDEKNNIIGFEYIAGTKEKFVNEGKNVLLVDAGDAVQGGAIGSISRGDYILKLLDESKYDVLIPGNHEYDYGMDKFLDFASKRPYISCNFVKDGNAVLPKYKMFDIGGRNVAFIGVTTPHTITSSTPKYFQNEKGDFIYGFNQDKLFTVVQETINEVKNKGADIVIVLAHLGNLPDCEPYTSSELIKSTNGIDAVIDGHSHVVVEKETYKNKDGKDVLLSQTGTKQLNVSLLTIDKEGKIDTRFLNKDELSLSDNVKSVIDNINKDYKAKVNEVVGKTDFLLVANEKKGEEVLKISRKMETNLGDLIADSYRNLTFSDCAIINGGGIRDNINEGNITYQDILNVNPFNNELSLVKVKGSVIKDTLEMGASKYPDFFGSFMQVSGVTYEIDSSIESSVKVDNNGMFTGVAGEYRVKNIMIKGEPLDVNKYYTLTGTSYTVKNCGDGMTMFKDAEIMLDSIKIDNMALLEYIRDDLNGVIPEKYKDPNGEGRIKILN